MNTVHRLLPLLISALALGACAPHGDMSHGRMESHPSPDLNLALQRNTDAGTYRIELSPPTEPLRVNKIHSWNIRLLDAQGRPVPDARIAVDGGMPEHGHGFPTQPRVSAAGTPGAYVLEGMKFNMTGWWEIKLEVQSARGADRITFNTVLPPSAS